MGNWEDIERTTVNEGGEGLTLQYSKYWEEYRIAVYENGKINKDKFVWTLGKKNAEETYSSMMKRYKVEVKNQAEAC